MADDALIDLTSQKPPEGFKGFSPTDVILIVVGGGVGFPESDWESQGSPPERRHD
jgi:hypothetical protein